MQTSTPRPPGRDPLPIAPRHLWRHLTPDQQRPLLTTLVHVCQELVVQETSRPRKEGADE